MSKFRSARILKSLSWLMWTAAVSIFASFSIAGQAAAQEFPSKVIKLIVPYPPGSTSDILARLLTPIVSKSLNQTIVVENRAGASTNIGAEYVARSAPDGYTLLMQAPNHVTNQFMFAELRWKPGDFAAITQLARYSNVLFAGPSAPTVDFKQLGQASRANPDGFSYGTPGVGSLSHLAMEMIKPRIGLQATHVVFTGPTPMITSVMGGHVEYGVTNPANFMGNVGKSGGAHSIRPIVVFGSQRDPTVPDVPSLGDYGISDIEAHGWLGLLAPAATPAPIISRLQQEFVKALEASETQSKLKSMYLQPVGSTPEEFAEFIESESAKWGKTIKAAGIEKQ